MRKTTRLEGSSRWEVAGGGGSEACNRTEGFPSSERRNWWGNTEIVVVGGAHNLLCGVLLRLAGRVMA